MTPVLVGMTLCVVAALVVLALVAVPRVRDGEKLFTPDGEESVRDASRRARILASQAVERATEAAEQAREKAGEVRVQAREKAEVVREQARGKARERQEAQARERAQAREKAAREKPRVGERARGTEQETQTGPARVDLSRESGATAADLRPATAHQKRGTATLPRTGATSPATEAAQVIDLRDGAPRTARQAQPEKPRTSQAAPDEVPATPATDRPAPAGPPARAAVAAPGTSRRRRSDRARDLQLGWGEPRPGPRHGR